MNTIKRIRLWYWRWRLRRLFYDHECFTCSGSAYCRSLRFTRNVLRRRADPYSKMALEMRYFLSLCYARHKPRPDGAAPDFTAMKNAHAASLRNMIGVEPF